MFLLHSGSSADIFSAISLMCPLSFDEYNICLDIGCNSNKFFRNEKFPMSLHVKIIVIVLAVVSLYAAFDYASQYFLVLPSFVALEHSEAQSTMRHCIGALRREISNLDQFTKNWAASDETYRFVKDQNRDYSSTNLGVKSLTKNELNLIYICDITGKVVWGEIRDLETNEIIQLDELPAGPWPQTHPLL